MRFLLVLLVVTFLGVAGLVAYAIGERTLDSERLKAERENMGDPVIERPLEIRQDGKRMRVRTSRCRTSGGDYLEDCPDQPYPRNVLRELDPRRPFRVTFSSVSRADLRTWRRVNGAYGRAGRWDATVQCIDSRCATEVEFPKDGERTGPVPRFADTLRIVLYDNPIEGAEVALAP